MDGVKPSEENYYYWKREDAEEHFRMFNDSDDSDDSDLNEIYNRIKFLVIQKQLPIVSREIKY